MLPSAGGGSNWLGGSFDPETKMLYVYSVTTPTPLGLVKSDGTRSDMNYISGPRAIRMRRRPPDADEPAGLRRRRRRPVVAHKAARRARLAWPRRHL